MSNDTPAQPAALCAQARQRVASGKPLEALLLYDQALALNPLHALAYADRGTTHAMLERFEPALADLQRALALGASSAPLYCTLGNVRKAQQQFDDALDWYGKAIVTDPAYALSYYNRGTLFQQLGRNAASLADFEKCLSFQPEGALRGRITQYITALRAALASPAA